MYVAKQNISGGNSGLQLRVGDFVCLLTDDRETAKLLEFQAIERVAKVAEGVAV
jgi:hypothetical protein